MQPMKLLSASLIILWSSATVGIEPADLVVVDKSESRLYLQKNGTTIASYHAALGGNPRGHKQEEGDERTPEGRYVLDDKKPDSAFHKSIHISYPNHVDRTRSRARGVNPGGQIMIHGQKNGFGWLSWITQRFDWTDGCIAVSNRAMDDIWDAVTVGTPIEIKP